MAMRASALAANLPDERFHTLSKWSGVSPRFLDSEAAPTLLHPSVHLFGDD